MAEIWAPTGAMTLGGVTRKSTLELKLTVLQNPYTRSEGGH